MTLLRILGLGVLLGASAAGLVWFAWGLIENVFAMWTGSPAFESEDLENAEADASEAA